MLKEPDQNKDLEAKYNVDEKGNVWNYMNTLDISIEKGNNYEIFTDSAQTGYHYYVKDNDGNVIDEGYHDWRGSFGFEVRDDILELDYGHGGPVWQRRYYDVSNGRVSRFFEKPVQVNGELVAYFTLQGEEKNWVLIVQNMFDPAIYHKEIYRDFSLFVYTMPSTAEFIDNGRKLRVIYWIKPDDKMIEETIDLGL